MNNKIKKGTTKVVAIDFLLSIVFGLIMLHGFYEVVSTFMKGKFLLLIWVIFLLIIEILLFIESLKLLKKNIKLWKAHKKQLKKKKSYIRKMKRQKFKLKR